MSNPLVKTLKNLKGNAKACLYTEPLWGLSIKLCVPYASVYMLALGLSDTKVGLVATINMFSQMIFAFLGGPITDKLGRRKTTAIFDFIAWGIPCIIWWNAQNFWFFMAAGLLNGTMRVAANAWDCLLVEDTDKSQITGIYSLKVVAGQLAVFFTPISALLILKFSLVPAIRILYLNAVVLVAVKIFLLYFFSSETSRGKSRIEESRHMHVFLLLPGYIGVAKSIVKNRWIVYALVMTALVRSVEIINNTFWQINVNKRLLVPDDLLPILLAVKSVIAITFLFVMAPFMNRNRLKLPLLAFISIFFAGQLLLILNSADNPFKYVLLCVSLFCDGFGGSSLLMLCGTLVAFQVNNEDRARIMAILHMLTMAISSPFGWIGGILSNFSKELPFALNLSILFAGFLFTAIHYKRKKPPKIPLMEQDVHKYISLPKK